MFGYYQLGTILNTIDRIPREVTISFAAYYLITDLHKRHAQVKIKEIEANAKIRTAELEVEALKIKRDMQEFKSDTVA